MNIDLTNNSQGKRDKTLPCGCKMHQFGFSGFVEWVVIEECKKPNCVYLKMLKENQ